MKLLASVATLLVVASAGADDDRAGLAFRVSGRSLATIYVDAGRDRGLEVGDRLHVVSGRTTLAEMKILAVEEHAAACRVLSLTRPIARGDRVVPAGRSSKSASPRSARNVEPAAKAPPRATSPVSASKGPPPSSPVPPPDPTPAKTPPTPPEVASQALLAAPGSSNGSASGPSLLEGAESPPPKRAVESPAKATSAQEPPAADADAAPASAPLTTANLHGASSPSLAAIGPPPSATVPEVTHAAPEPAPVAPTTPPPAPASRRFTVKYRSATSAYLDAGRAEGLEVGDRLRVLAGTTPVAELEVAYVSELSASCKVLSETRPVQAGDVARPASGAPRSQETNDAHVPAPGPGPSATSAASTTPAALAEVWIAESPSPVPWGRLRGAASFGYARSWDQTPSALDFQQRTARVDVGVYDIAGQPLSFRLRARSRQDVRARTLSLRTPRNERTDRLYELALRYEPLGDPVAVELGRIGMYRFVGIGYLDGALVRFRPRPGVRIGAFGGRRIEIAGSHFDGIGRSYGAFVRFVPEGRYVRRGYDVLLAYARDNADGDVSREYLSLESSFGDGSRWSLFQRAELDLNRGWREEITGTGYQLSNISLSGNLRLSRAAWAFLSYDGRRNYRYYRNRLVPEEVFDDLLHQGLRAGLNIATAGGFGATAGFGMSLKEPDPRHPELNIANAYSFNAGLRHSNLFSSGLSAGLNGSGFTNGYADGGLLSAHVGWLLGRGHMLDLAYGYSLYRVIETEESRSTRWLRLLGRAQLTRWFYILGDLEYDAGDDLEGPRLFLELGFLF